MMHLYEYDPECNDDDHHHPSCFSSLLPTHTGRKRRRPLPTDESDRIARHMNLDHKDAVILYAKHYGGMNLANAASIVEIDHDGMDLSVTVSSSAKPRNIRIDFEKPLQVSNDDAGPTECPPCPLTHTPLVRCVSTQQDAKDAKSVLANMAKAASTALGIPVKSEEENLLSLNPLTDVTYGYLREEMGKKNLVGSVKKYNTHLFLVWKKASEWPKNIEDGPEENLPKIMSKILNTHKKNMSGKVGVEWWGRGECG